MCDIFTKPHTIQDTKCLKISMKISMKEYEVYNKVYAPKAILHINTLSSVLRYGFHVLGDSVACFYYVDLCSHNTQRNRKSVPIEPPLLPKKNNEWQITLDFTWVEII